MGSSAVTRSSGSGGMSSSPAITLSVGTVGDSAAPLVPCQPPEVKTKLVVSAVPKVGDAASVPPMGGVSVYSSEEREEVAVRPLNTSLPLYWKPANSASSRSTCATSSAEGASPAARRCRTPPATAPYAQPGTPYTNAHFARRRAVAVARYT